MTLLRPLLESSEDPLERALLASARGDAPSRMGLQDTALALGLAAPAARALADTLLATQSLAQAAALRGAPGALSGAGGAGAATSATAAASTLSAKVSFALVGKYVVGGALASFLALGALEHTLVGASSSEPSRSSQQAAAAPGRAAEPGLRRNGSPSTSTPAEQASPGEPAASASESVANAPDNRANRLSPSARALKASATNAAPKPAGAAPEVEAPKPAPAAAPAVEASATPKPASASNASLGEEIRTLDRARAALAAGDAPTARRLLDQYAAGPPSGILDQEAGLLRVRLLLELGDRRAASELARSIIRDHPESSHGDSLRTLAAEP